MSSFLRFFREHLKRFLPLIAAGSLLLTLAGACQGILIATLRFVLGDSLSMGGPVDSTASRCGPRSGSCRCCPTPPT